MLFANVWLRVFQFADVVDRDNVNVPVAVAVPPWLSSVLKNSRPVIVIGPLNALSL